MKQKSSLEVKMRISVSDKTAMFIGKFPPMISGLRNLKSVKLEEWVSLQIVRPLDPNISEIPLDSPVSHLD